MRSVLHLHYNTIWLLLICYRLFAEGVSAHIVINAITSFANVVKVTNGIGQHEGVIAPCEFTFEPFEVVEPPFQERGCVVFDSIGMGDR